MSELIKFSENKINTAIRITDDGRVCLLYMGLTEKDDEHLPGGYGYNLVQVKQRITVMKTTMVPNISQPDLAKDCGTFPILTPVWQMVAAGFLR